MKAPVKAAQRINLLLALKRQSLFIVLLGTVTFAATGSLVYFVLTKQSYTSTIELRIDPTTDSVVLGVDNSSSNSMTQFYSAYVATQKYKILKLQTIQKALETLDPALRRALLEGKPVSPATVDGLSRRLLILPSYDSLILTVSISGSKPDGLADFLNTLIEVYLQELKTEKTNLESNRIGFADKQMSTLQQQIAATTARIRQISEETATGNFNSDDIPYRNEFKIQEETAIRAENDRLLKENLYRQFVSQMGSMVKTDTDTKTEERLKTDALLGSKRRLILSKLDAITNQISGTKAGPDQTKLNSDAADLQQQLQDLESSYRERYRVEVQAEIKAALEKQKQSLYSDFQVAKQYEDGVKASFASIKEKYSVVSRKILEAQELQQDLINLKAQADKVNTSLTYFQGEQQANSHVTIENPAKTPLEPDKSTLTKNMVIAFLVSYLGILVLFMLIEFLDGRIKSPEELKSFSGIKPSWPISHFKGDFRLVHMEGEESVVKKAIRSLATRINRERQDFQAKIVAFNGVDHRVGCTEIMLNCAYAMTDNCETILVMELNRETPGLALKLGIPKRNLPSAKDLETMTLESAVVRDAARGFDVLAVQNPEKLENKNIERLLTLARERYDIVFLDCAPVLRSSATEFLFPESDVVVFIVLGNKSTYSTLGNTLELGQKLGVSSAALVLNWWHPDPKEEKYQDPPELT